MTDPTYTTKRDLIVALIESLDGEGSLDDVVLVKNLNDDRSDEDEQPKGVYNDNLEIEAESDFFQICFYGPVMEEDSSPEDID